MITPRYFLHGCCPQKNMVCIVHICHGVCPSDSGYTVFAQGYYESVYKYEDQGESSFSRL